jgi:DNA (cytosine-5)-methyltransferase 1
MRMATGQGGAEILTEQSPPLTCNHESPIAFDSRQDTVSSTEVFGALGSASPQAQAVCVTGDITHTLKAEGFDASEDGTGRGQPIVAAFQSSQSGVRLSDTYATLDANNGPRRHNGALVDMAVRRLTPRECERLQGFPDDYTLITVRGKPAADGPRYKALGNSWAVPNVHWIGRRIHAALMSLEAAC